MEYEALLLILKSDESKKKELFADVPLAIMECPQGFLQGWKCPVSVLLHISTVTIFQGEKEWNTRAYWPVS